MDSKSIKQSTRPSLQQSMTRHKKNYQKYLNNIYQTIRQKQFYVHRSQTPNLQAVNVHDISKLSQRGVNGQRQDNLKSLPKLSAKDTISNQVIQIVLASCDNNTKNNKPLSPAKKTNSSVDKKSQPINQSPLQKNSIYHFGNFPQPRPSISSYLYVSPALRQSKQLSKNSTISKQKMLQQTKQLKQIKQSKIPLSQRAKRSSINATNQNKQQKISLYKKISKDNMNLLGLNVQKMNYSEKRDVINNNRKLMFMRFTKPQQKQLIQENVQDFDCQKLQGQDNFYDASKTQNNFSNFVDQNGNYINKRLTPELNNMIDMDVCQQLISQKMQFSKRQNCGQPQTNRKNQNMFSPSRQRRRISASQKKTFVPNTQQQLNPIYQNRYKKYLDLVLKLSFSYKKYGELDPQITPSSHTQLRNDKKYKAWIGNGNNGNLLKALIKRRYWWQIVQQKSWGVNFLWTQLKNNQYFKAQNQKLKIKNTISVNKAQKSMEGSTKLDESTCLSVDNEQSSQKKISLIKRTRAQSSLPGSIGNKRKQLSSPVKRTKNFMNEEQNKILSRFLNKQEILDSSLAIKIFEVIKENYPKNLNKQQLLVNL